MNTKITAFIRQEWLQLLLITLPFLAALAAMPFATDRVPMQWNLQGQVNWYAPKSWGLIIIPLTTLVTMALVLFIERRDPSRLCGADGHLTAHGKATRMIRIGITLLLGAVALLQITTALGHTPDVSRWVVTSVALLFAFMGNLFGKLKPNRYVGIRVPWTLNSEHVWRQTHRVAGWVWSTSSLIVAAMSWLLPAHLIYTHLTWLWLFFLIAVPLFIAWHEARRERQALPIK